MQTENAETNAIQGAFRPQNQHTCKHYKYEPNPNKLSYQNVVNEYLFQDTVQWTTLNLEDK